MTPWSFFVFVVRWVAAIFGTLACSTAIVIFLAAVVYEVRELFS